jgi:phosphonate transport system substrate-binding protein
MPRSIALVLALAGATCTSCSEAPAPPPPPVLRVAAVPAQPGGDPLEQFHPLATYLEERLGVRVEIVPVKRNGTAVELFTRGYVGLAWLAVRGARAIAQGDTDRDHFTFLVAHRRTGLERSIRFPPALASLRFTFGPERSIPDHLMPEYFIWRATGLWPEQFFVRSIGFSEGPEHTLALILSEEYDAGAIDERIYGEWVRSGKVSAEVLRVVWRTPPYAMHHWTAHPAIEEQFGRGFTAKVQDALLAIDDPSVLGALGREHMIPASDRLYDGIRFVAAEHGMLR